MQFWKVINVAYQGRECLWKPRTLWAYPKRSTSSILQLVKLLQTKQEGLLRNLAFLHAVMTCFITLQMMSKLMFLIVYFLRFYYAARDLTKANVSSLWFSIRATRSRRNLDISTNRGLAYMHFPALGPIAWVFFSFWLVRLSSPHFVIG